MGERKVERCGNRLSLLGEARQPCALEAGHAGKCQPYPRCPICGRRRCRGACARVIREAVEAVRVEKYYGDEYTAAEVDAALDALLAELGIQEDR